MFEIALFGWHVRLLDIQHMSTVFLDISTADMLTYFYLYILANKAMNACSQADKNKTFIECNGHCTSVTRLPSWMVQHETVIAWTLQKCSNKRIRHLLTIVFWVPHHFNGAITVCSPNFVSTQTIYLPQFSDHVATYAFDSFYSKKL